MPAWQNYLQPATVAEALQQLQSAPGPAKAIAGGTDLLLDIQQRRHPPVDTLVDLSSISEMRETRLDGEAICLGAAVTHYEIINNPLLIRHAPCLVEACGVIGGPQVRNVATIGGNVAHGLPAGDGTIALLALDAQVEIAGPGGRRWLPIEELFVAPGCTLLQERSELLVSFRLPLAAAGESSAFHRVMRPQGVAIAILNMAAWLRASGDGTIADIRLAAGPAGPRPFRPRRTEAFLRGRRPDGETIASAACELAAEASLRTSPHRATAEYRQQLLPILLGRVLEPAFARAMEL